MKHLSSDEYSSNEVWTITLATVLFLTLCSLAYTAQIHSSRNHHVPTSVAAVSQDLTPSEYTAKISNPDTVFRLTIDDNSKIISGPTKITVKQGESVNINFYAKGSEALINLDGYGISTETSPEKGADGGFHFIADKVGTFPFYSASDGDEPDEGRTPIQLGTVVVEP